MSYKAYKRAQAVGEKPRATEERLMTEITGEMVQARDSGCAASALMPALHRNREVWTALSAACGSAGNGLPAELRASIVSLALWINRYTTEVIRGREEIEALIDVNRSIIAGLQQRREIDGLPS